MCASRCIINLCKLHHVIVANKSPQPVLEQIDSNESRLHTRQFEYNTRYSATHRLLQVLHCNRAADNLCKQLNHNIDTMSAIQQQCISAHCISTLENNYGSHVATMLSPFHRRLDALVTLTAPGTATVPWQFRPPCSFALEMLSAVRADLNGGCTINIITRWHTMPSA